MDGSIMLSINSQLPDLGLWQVDPDMLVGAATIQRRSICVSPLHPTILYEPADQQC